ncbi:hypothetical protein [Microbacterium sp. CIAB417]|uniref:HAAS signaling domain-containing protein n=1 Tax=Microbacterium sp. CIAB417 TaxID=2860287 RepID=UPI001FACF84B|nr:hypothetical protein [Microbacterium sp. CIAB417]
MIETDADRLRTEYLTRLDVAMRDLPHGVASEIRAGIAEELEGRDAEAIAARIAALGDPADIAREAQDEVPVPPVVMVAPPVAAPAGGRPPATGTRGFAIAAALTLSFGGIVLPFAGWIVGVVLVCFSTLWRVWEKVVAVLIPFVTAAFSILVWSSFSVAATVEESGSGITETVNPLVPAWYDVVWSGALLIGILLVPASGLWLLWRLRGRTER